MDGQAADHRLELLEEARLGDLAPLLEREGEVVEAMGGGLRVVGHGGLRRRPVVGGRRVGVLAPRRDGLVGRDPGHAHQVLGGRRLGPHAGGLAGRLGERGVDVRRVVELDELGGRLDDLRLADPLAGLLVLVPGAAAEREVGSDREVVGIVVDEGQAADLVDPGGVRGQEAIELLGRPGRGSRSARAPRRGRAHREGRRGSRPWRAAPSSSGRAERGLWSGGS